VVIDTDYIGSCKSDKLDDIMLYRVHLAWVGFEFSTSVVIGTDRDGPIYVPEHNGTYRQVYSNI